LKKDRGEATPFDPDPDNILEVIEKRLFDNKGKVKIERGFAEINRIYEKASFNYSEKNREYDKKLKDCQSDSQTLKKELEKLNEIKNGFDEVLKQTIYDGKKTLDNVFGKSCEAVKKGVEKVDDKCNEIIKRYDYDEMKSLGLSIENGLMKEIKFKEISEFFYEKVEENFESQRNELMNFIKKNGMDDRKYNMMLEKNTTMDLNDIAYNLDLGALQELINDLPSWFLTRGFDELFGKGQDARQKDLENEVSSQLEEIKEELLQQVELIRSQYSGVLQNLSQHFERILNEDIRHKQSTIEASKQNKDKEIKFLEKAIEENTEKLEYAETRQKNFKKLFNEKAQRED
jgi:DNA repair exonuclease SbcCD ATPase subunit